ncbi:beta-lactamase [Neoasaia chiangmaiensis NBRC 101099]|nr:serine hydrolase [Neoasaia chiangmaiensis]GBR41986.1 beta-lactamase [Neoasaia chiangmaiensis NBRC 101099]GEN14222.1 serine hydrolase [Neoasaia chiangmaiensis]
MSIAYAAPPDIGQIDRLAARVQKEFNVPGIGIGIVQDGHVVLARGYGVQDGPGSPPVDARTLFGIGSNTKAFTAAGLGVLVDDGKLHWNDRMEDVLPGFQLADPWLTREFRVSDLLTHHSGMGLGAGDLLLFSRSNFARAELLPRLRDMPFTGRFRQDYAYNNLLYSIAGVTIEHVSHDSWEHFIQSRIIDAAGMPRCTTQSPTRPEPGFVTGHSVEDGVLRATKIDPLIAAAPAGGIVCSIDGMNVWMRLLLAGGVAPNGQRILSEKTRDDLWTPHALLDVPDNAVMTGTHFRAYGYGWFLEDFHGAKRVWHTGTVSGMVSLTSMLPEAHAGVVVLTNQEDHAATQSLALSISEMLLGDKPNDWVKYYRDRENRDQARPKPQFRFVTLDPAEQHAFVGTYRDAWRGDLIVAQDTGGLRLTFSRADGLTGRLQPLPHDLFVVRWDNRAMDGSDDSYVQFHRDTSGKVTDMTLRVVDHDFSFDVQDMHPIRVEAPDRK